MVPWERVSVIQNETNEVIEIIVTVLPAGRVRKRVLIPKGSSTLVAVKWFLYNPYNPGCDLTISVVVDGRSSYKGLTSEDFITYGKIIMARDTDGVFQISGIKPRWKDLGRIRGLGLIFGRSYGGGRQREIIIR